MVLASCDVQITATFCTVDFCLTIPNLMTRGGTASETYLVLLQVILRVFHRLFSICPAFFECVGLLVDRTLSMSTTFFSACCFFSELTEMGTLKFSCFPSYLPVLEGVDDSGAEYLKLRSFLILASFLMKVAKTLN